MTVKYAVAVMVVCVLAGVSTAASAFTYANKHPHQMTLSFAKRDASAKHKEQVLKDRFAAVRDAKSLKSVMQYIADFNNAFIRIDVMREKTTGLLSPSTMVRSIYGMDRNAVMRLRSFAAVAASFTNVRALPVLLGGRGLDVDQLLRGVPKDLDVERLHRQSRKIEDFLYVIATFMKSRRME